MARFKALVVVFGSLVPLLGAGIVGVLPAPLGFAAFSYGAAALVLWTALSRLPQSEIVGWCNVVTLLRLAAICALMASVLAPASTGILLTVAIGALLLDGVDGWLARKMNQTTDFGARFDMETDALFGLVLALNAWSTGHVGASVILLGVPRYLFLLVGRRWRWILEPLPESRARKVVCVLQLVALLVLQLPVLAGAPAAAVLWLTLTALICSFGRDIWWLWRNQP